MYEVFVVKDGKLARCAVYRDRLKLKELVSKLVQKKVPVQKI